MKKSLISVSILLTFSLISCGHSSTPDTSSNVEPTTSTTTTTEEQVDYGKLTIEDQTVYIGYPKVEFQPVFSKEEYKEQVQFEYSDELIEIDANGYTVIAKEDTGRVSVRAFTSHLETTFTVYVDIVDRNNQYYNTTPYDSYQKSLEAKYAKSGTDGETTLFIGDSFFDVRYFWTNFYETYAGKDAICAGISSSTTFDWEVYSFSWLKNISPKNLVMHCGTNNLYDDHQDADKTIEDIERLFNLFHGVMPETNLYYFSITQRTDTRYKDRCSAVNEAIEEWMSTREWVTFMDTCPQLTGDKLRDGVHPKLENYSIFVNALASTNIEISDKHVEPGFNFDDNGTYDKATGKLTVETSGTLTRSYLTKDGLPYNGDFAVSGHIKFTNKIGGNPFSELIINKAPDSGWYNADSPLPVSDILFGNNGSSQIWGFKNGAANEGLGSFTNNEADFTVIGLGKSVLFKCNNAVVTYTDNNINDKYFGISVENASVEATLNIITEQTDIANLWNELSPKPTDAISDIYRETYETVGTSQSIKYKGETLDRNFILQGKLDITEKTTNAHIEFRYNGMDKRVLFWDNASDGNFKLCVAYNTNVAQDHIFKFNENTTNISWKIVITADDVYFYVGNTLMLTSTGIGHGNPNLYVGSENAKCKFYEMSALSLLNDEAAYRSALTELGIN